MAVAGQSDRYKDLRLDTSITAFDYTKPVHGVAIAQSAKTVQPVLSTRNTSKPKGPRDNLSPYGGFGPYNDSR